MADTLVLEASGVIRGGSSPPLRTSALFFYEPAPYHNGVGANITFEESAMALQVSREHLGGLEHRLTITTPTDMLHGKVEARLKKILETAQMPGFRKGKIPLSVGKQRFESSLIQEELHKLLGEAFYGIVKDEKIPLAGQPAVDFKEQFEKGKDLTFTATYEVIPEIKNVSFNKAEVQTYASEVTEKDIDDQVKVLLGQHTTWVSVERASENGDRILVDFLGKVDGVPFQGGEAKGYGVVLGSKSMIPGFEEGLLGLKTGDTKDLKVKFPDEYHSEALKGKEAVFEIKVHDVLNPQLPELNDDFAKKIKSKEGTAAGLRMEVKQNLEFQLKRALAAKNKKNVLDKLLELHKVDVPKAFVQQEIGRLKAGMQSKFGGKMPDMPDELFADNAKSNVLLGLLMSGYIEEHQIKAEASHVDKMIDDIAVTYQNSAEEVKAYYHSNPQEKSQLESLAIEDLAVEKLLASATAKVKHLTFQEAVK